MGFQTLYKLGQAIGQSSGIVAPRSTARAKEGARHIDVTQESRIVSQSAKESVKTLQETFAALKYKRVPLGEATYGSGMGVELAGW